MKRIISIIVCVIMLLNMVTLPVLAEPSVVDGLSPNVAKAYYDVINKIVNKYGIAVRDEANYVFTKGLLYNELVDFDGNGSMELYLIYNTESKYTDKRFDFEERYTEEIWMFENGKIKKIHEHTYGDSASEHGFMSSSFGKKDNKVYMILSGERGYGDESHDYANMVYELKGGKLNKVVNITSNYSSSETSSPTWIQRFEERGKTFEFKTEEEYWNKVEEVLSKYGKNEKNKLISERENVEFSSFARVNLEIQPNPNELISKLKNRMIKSYNLKDIYPKKSDAEKSEIIKFLNGFNVYYFTDKFDGSKDYGKALSFILYDGVEYNDYNVKYEKQSNIKKDDGGWSMIRADIIDKQVYERFGLSANHNYKDEYMFYADGYYHYFRGGAGDLYSSTQPNSMYQIDKNTYYIDFTIYWIEEQESGDIDNNQPKQLWNKGLNSYGIDNNGYAVIKKTNKGYELLKYNRVGGSLSPEEVSLYKSKINPKSNVKIDYSKIKDYTKPSEYILYLDKLLSSTKEPLNNNAKNDIVKYIEYAIENSATSNIETKRNTVKVTPDAVKEELKNADNTKKQFDILLSKHKIKTNKAIDITLKVNAEKVYMEKAVRVQFDTGVESKLGSANGIKVVLDSNNHSVYISKENLQGLIKESGYFAVEIKKEKDKYNITFLNKDNKPSEQITYPVTLALSTDSEFATIFANYKGGSENWGGQYDTKNKTIEFSTRYSGEYSILKKEINISDIGDLTEGQQKAIKFMVSKGFFTLDGDKFNPYGVLSRYDFNHVLVKIFFALDSDAKTTFTDVKNDNKYYQYISSAQKANIAKGFEDNTFRGDLATTKEEVITFCGRTLADKKSYNYPEDVNEYLQFVDNDSISNWAKQDVALSVRSSLIEGGGLLNPQSQITRVEGAEILYKLFMLLYDVSPASTAGPSPYAGIPLDKVALPTVLFLACGTGVLFFIRNKSKKAYN